MGELTASAGKRVGTSGDDVTAAVPVGVGASDPTGDEVVPGLSLRAELGRGAHAVVYRATRGGVDYALKLLAADVADPRTMADFRREAALLACVNHPGVVSIHEVGQARGRPYLVMELVEGQTLAEAMAAGPLDEVRAVAVAIDVADALAAAHRAGVTHRDIKPHNIMILPDGRAKVIDFGLAARAAAGGADDTTAGTLAYSAPEQTGMLKRPVDGRADLYSLGVVLFHAATGRPPFTAVDVGVLLRQHSVTPAPDVRDVRRGLSAAFAAIVAKLLAKDPDDRYQTGHGLAADLRALAAGAVPAAGTAPAAGFTVGVADLPVATAEAPLVGRADELAQLTARWVRAREGHGGIALVGGPPGGGKSRLVSEVLAAAAGAGHPTLRGKLSADDPVPMGPIRAAVERYLTELERLPPDAREARLACVRRAAGRGASLLGALSPALAALLSAPDLADEDRREQFAVSVATFLAGLARANGGGILCLDDVQWLDAGTRRVLHHLTDDLPDSPLLVVVTVRDDAASRPAYEEFLAEFDAATDTRMVLHPLDDAAITRLVQAHLGGADLTPELAAALVARSGGNPFTADEYVRAMVDAGLVRPSWGTWVLEEGGLDALDLPDNVLDLILARVAGLGVQTRRLLVAAAAVGIRFRAADLAQVCRVDPAEVTTTLRLAVDRRLVTAEGEGRYAFVHDRIREALLVDLDEEERRRLHLRIAVALDEVGSTEAEYVYAVARHYNLGGIEAAPIRAFRAAVAAGQLALANHAPQEALEFMRTAESAAAAGAITPDIGFHETYGIAWLRVGGFFQARAHLETALAAEPAATRRAMLRGLICEAHHADWEVAESLAAAERALTEIGRALPRNRWALVLSTLGLFVGSLGVKWLGLGRGSAAGAVRERLRIEAAVLAIAAQAAAAGRQMLLLSCLAFRQLYPVNRIGPGPEYVHAHAELAGVAKILGLRRLSNRMFRRVSRIAVSLGDPRLVAYVGWVNGIIETTVRNSKVDASEVMRRVLSEHGRWMHAQEHLTAAIVLCNRLTMEGNAIEARRWYDRTRVRVSNADHGDGHHFLLTNTAIHAVMGPGEEADRELALFRDFLATRPDNRQQLVQYVVTALLSTVEQGQLGAQFERAVQMMEDAGLTPWTTWASQHNLWAFAAYGRLAQARSAPDAEREVRLAAAERAVRRMRAAATTPVLKVHQLIIRASYRQLTGDHAGALRLLERADRRAQLLDVPVLGYEAAVVRARALGGLGSGAQAHRQARAALHIALECGWEHRMRAVKAEFGLGETAPAGRARGTVDAGAVPTHVYRRRLDALQQVSIAAATVLEPRELARVALRETIDILGAERAFLFLVDGDTGQLVPHLGRDAAGADLDELTGYGASLVTRVRNTGEPLVVTGAEGGEAHGSRSALVHGLRSIVVAPLRLKGRVQGVVYLDSRVAKGIFTADDVDILAAITNHVAVSLETARAAQLEVAVQAVRRQRDVAELLHSSMAQVSTTLEPDEVLRRLMTAVSEATTADAACLLRRRGDTFAVAAVAVAGQASDLVVGKEFDGAAAGPLVALTGRGAPTRGGAGTGTPAPLPAVLPDPRSWVAVPLVARGAPKLPTRSTRHARDSAPSPTGLLLLASAAENAYTDAHLQIAAALAGQGMTAYDNACLFEQVNQLATVDSLTGVPNRRHFLARAERAFEAAGAGADSRLTAVMLDIDHFKRVNDTYGHLVGDTVIGEVARRLGSVVREGDLLGRFGGEEFAVVLAAAPDRAADLAQRLRGAVAASAIDTAAGPVAVTVSVGLAHREPGDTDLGVLLGRADRALYRAKDEGRDRVVAA